MPFIFSSPHTSTSIHLQQQFFPSLPTCTPVPFYLLPPYTVFFTCCLHQYPHAPVTSSLLPLCVVVLYDHSAFMTTTLCPHLIWSLRFLSPSPPLSFFGLSITPSKLTPPISSRFFLGMLWGRHMFVFPSDTIIFFYTQYIHEFIVSPGFLLKLSLLQG